MIDWESMPGASPTYAGLRPRLHARARGRPLAQPRAHLLRRLQREGRLRRRHAADARPDAGLPRGQGHVRRARARPDPQLHGLLDDPCYESSPRARSPACRTPGSTTAPSERRSGGARLPRYTPPTAPVAQGIERSPPEREVGGSNPPGRMLRSRRQALYVPPMSICTTRCCSPHAARRSSSPVGALTALWARRSSALRGSPPAPRRALRNGPRPHRRPCRGRDDGGADLGICADRPRGLQLWDAWIPSRVVRLSDRGRVRAAQAARRSIADRRRRPAGIASGSATTASPCSSSCPDDLEAGRPRCWRRSVPTRSTCPCSCTCSARCSSWGRCWPSPSRPSSAGGRRQTRPASPASG